MKMALRGLITMVLVGCGGAKNPSSPTGDGGQPSTTTTGSGGGASSLGGGGSGGAAGGPGAGAGGSVEVVNVIVSTVDQHQVPIEGLPIVINDASGAVVAVHHADATGKRSVAVPRSGSVSVFISLDLSFGILSVFDPPEGATVKIPLYRPDPPPPPPPAKTTFNVKAKNYPVPAKRLQFSTCWDQVGANDVLQPTYTAVLNDATCEGAQSNGFLVIESDAMENPITWGATFGIPSHPGIAVDVEVAANQFAFDQSTITIESIPNGATQAGMQVEPKAANRIDFRPNRSIDNPPGGSYVQQFFIPKGIFESYDVTEYVELEGMTAMSTLRRDRRHKTLPVSSSFDARSIALVSVAPLDVSNKVHPQATWSLSEAPRGDSGTIIIDWSSGTSSVEYWAIFPAGHPTSLRLPDIPPELSSYAPSATSSFGMTEVGYTDLEAVGSYGEIWYFQDVPVVDGLGTVESWGYTYESSP